MTKNKEQLLKAILEHGDEMPTAMQYKILGFAEALEMVHNSKE